MNQAGLTPLEIAIAAKETLVEKRREAASELVSYIPTKAAMESVVLIDSAIQALDRAIADERKRRPMPDVKLAAIASRLP